MSLIETLLDLDAPKAIKLSPDRQLVVYSTTKPLSNRTGDHDLSTLWLANTGHAGSARQLTSGEYNDHSPQWFPDGKSVAFISDREKPGERWAIYSASSDPAKGVSALTPVEHERKIEKFEISPNGEMIAWLVADEKSDEQRAKEEEKDDVKVFGLDPYGQHDWEYARLNHRLRLWRLDSEGDRVSLINPDAHFYDFAWSDDGGHVAVLETRDSNMYVNNFVITSTCTITSTTISVAHARIAVKAHTSTGPASLYTTPRRTRNGASAYLPASSRPCNGLATRSTQ